MRTRGEITYCGEYGCESPISAVVHYRRAAVRYRRYYARLTSVQEQSVPNTPSVLEQPRPSRAHIAHIVEQSRRTPPPPPPPPPRESMAETTPTEPEKPVAIIASPSVSPGRNLSPFSRRNMLTPVCPGVYVIAKPGTETPFLTS